MSARAAVPYLVALDYAQTDTASLHPTLAQGKQYESASEFEWAKNLLDPRVNLALCLERAGRVDAAMESYEAALAVLPNDLPAVQGIACLTLKNGREDKRLEHWFDDIALRGDEAGWRAWALARHTEPH